MRVFIGMETSGETRRAFAAAGHQVISCDLLPAQDAVATVTYSGCKIDLYPEYVTTHVIGDVFAVLFELMANGWWPDFALFHPDCTHLTGSAAWAFKDPDYIRYPGVGYHMKVKPGTLTGKARRDARDAAVTFVRQIWALPIEKLAVENPVGFLSSMWMEPTQIVQPFEFGDDASKATCLWFRNLPHLVVNPGLRVPGRWVEWPRGSGIFKERWANQTDSGQNNLPPKTDRWQDRADTYPGISRAMALNWSN